MAERAGATRPGRPDCGGIEIQCGSAPLGFFVDQYRHASYNLVSLSLFVGKRSLSMKLGDDCVVIYRSGKRHFLDKHRYAK